MVTAERMSWDHHDGWALEIKLFGLILQLAIGKSR
jgi:hypothetical protein